MVLAPVADEAQIEDFASMTRLSIRYMTILSHVFNQTRRYVSDYTILSEIPSSSRTSAVRHVLRIISLKVP